MVVWDLKENYNKDAFKQYLSKNKISIVPQFLKSEVHFKVENLEEAESFLEIAGHIFEGAKYKLEIHGENYKSFS